MTKKINSTNNGYYDSIKGDKNMTNNKSIFSAIEQDIMNAKMDDEVKDVC